jgi:hypothetical protein
MKKLKKNTQTQNNPTDLKYPKPDKSNLIFMPIVETGKQQMMPDGSHQYVLCISKKGQDPLQIIIIESGKVCHFFNYINLLLKNSDKLE